MSEPSDEQAAMQHYLVCGTEDCQKNGQFYCNACHRPLCEQCRDEHQKSPKNKNHEIVIYRHRKHQLPVEKCQDHPTRNLDIFCRECKAPICSKCSTMKEHEGHKFDDLEDIYADKYALWQGEFSKIQKYFLPTSQDLKTDIEEDVKQIKKIMESIRTSMKAEAESLKNLVDEVTSENVEHTHTMEKSLLKLLKSEETTYDDYIAYLWKMSDEFQEYLSITNQKLLFKSKTLKIQPIPETTKPVPPVFNAGQFNKNDIKKLLGNVNVPNTKPQKRKIQPMEAVTTHMKSTEKKLEQSKEKSNAKQTLSLSSSVTKVREYNVPDVNSAYHVSIDKSGRFWVSDSWGNLVQTDLQGNLLQEIQTGGGKGYHTATQNGELIYTDQDKNVIYRITPDKKITEFIKTGDWKPRSVHSSHINGDILVGMYKLTEAKVTRYTKAGKEIQNIQRDNKGQKLYRLPYYITENINGDICTSDYNKRAVVVVNKSGQHRFSYTGQGQSQFQPYGICTDVLSHILVCEIISESVHLLDQDGEFLSVILSPQQGIKSPIGVCVDDENNLYVGQDGTKIVTVYKYLQ
uniref:LOW QUALITY PROTEIN: tripartite motif-containing protein 55-like n=1 Tax=Crassostrea virginica TaxID=6565 RepID=A0A8B8F0Q0_CRAVI|nr:LOW QUALITY PROTEIN: tripartite motif-containing protein 55-like [Crassostrea virginica]